jgi:hypothetical protein
MADALAAKKSTGKAQKLLGYTPTAMIGVHNQVINLPAGF